PRTPMMRFLVQLAADHAAAARAGIPTEALRERRALRGSPAGASRREFLAGAGALVTALALPARARAQASGPRIAIVGGGIAGLRAALTVAEAGVGSTVYESAGRLGGRMFSNATTWADGQVSEWCGELIDTRHKTVLALARRFNLPVTDLVGAQANGTEDT